MYKKMPAPLVYALSALAAAFFCFSTPLLAQAQIRRRDLQIQQSSTVKELPAKSKRWALVIGVDQYRDGQISSLRGAVNDAHTLADALVRHAGFPGDQVVLLATDQPEERQPTRVNILRRLSNLTSVVPKDGLLLVSFAGHGIERQGQAYLLPSDAQVSNDISLLEDTALSVTRVKERIKATGVKQVIVLLDACRNDPGGRADSPNLMTSAFTKFDFDVRNREVEAFATLYATAVGQRAYEYTEKRQGYFTWALVEGLKGAAANDRGEVRLAGLVRYVQETVPKQIGVDLGVATRQRPFAVIEGYRAEDLIIAVAGRSRPSAGADVSKTPPVPLVKDDTKELSRQVEVLLVRRDYDGAIKAASEAISLNPGDPNIYLNRGIAHREKREMDEAIKDYTEAIRLNPQLLFAFIERARAYAGKNEYSQAIKDYTEAIRLNPQLVTAFSERGTAYLDNYEHSQAIKDYTEAIRLDPQNARNYMIRAEAYYFFEPKDYERAIEDYTEAIRLRPQDSQAYESRGNSYRHLGHYDEAIGDYTEYLRLRPDNERDKYWNTHVYHNRGLAYYLKGDFTLAINDFTKTIETGEAVFIEEAQLAAAYTNRADAYEKLGVKDKAAADRVAADKVKANGVRVKLLYSAEQEAKDRALRFATQAKSLKGQGKFDEAIKAASEAIRLNPQLTPALTERAEIYISRKIYDQAADDLDEAIRLEPTNATAYALRAMVYSEKGEYDRALKEVNEAIRHDPQNATAYALRSGFYTLKGNYELALKDADEAIRRDPRVAIFYFYRASAYARKGDYNRALNDLTEAIRLNPQFADAYESRASVYQQLGMTAKAHTDRSKAAELKGGSR